MARSASSALSNSTTLEKNNQLLSLGQKRRGAKRESKKNQNICKNASKQLLYSMNIISFIINKKSDFWHTFIFFYKAIYMTKVIFKVTLTTICEWVEENLN